MTNMIDSEQSRRWDFQLCQLLMLIYVHIYWIRLLKQLFLLLFYYLTNANIDKRKQCKLGILLLHTWREQTKRNIYFKQPDIDLVSVKWRCTRCENMSIRINVLTNVWACCFHTHILIEIPSYIQLHLFRAWVWAYIHICIHTNLYRLDLNRTTHYIWEFQIVIFRHMPITKRIMSEIELVSIDDDECSQDRHRYKSTAANVPPLDSCYWHWNRHILDALHKKK
jgi:hypothetical protein